MQAGNRVIRRPLFLAIIAIALTIVCPSAFAQLPQLPQLPTTSPNGLLPLEDGALEGVLPGRVGEDVGNAQLPAPVEDAVNASPVAPVREEVRRVIGGADDVSGGTAGGPSGGTSPAAVSSATSPATTSRPRSAPTGPDGGGDSSTGEKGTDPQPRAGARKGVLGESPGATGDRGAVDIRSASPRGRAEPRRSSAPADDDQNPVARTIVKIVDVVPTAIWLALGALFALALAMSARAFVERRRAREAESDRQRLIRDVGVLERALLPAVPEMLGALAISVAHRAAEGLAAGGDFYDAFELSGGRVALLVGDVSGHGPDALERTNELRTSLRACLEAGVGPRAALESVSRRSGIEPSGQFATVAVAIHNPADGTLTFATAGHPPPILAGPGTHEPLTTASSPPVGAGLRTGLRETTVPLPLDTVVCFFTDGLLEARVCGDLIGREELTRFVAELGPEQYADSLLAQVIAVADDTPDDMVVCVLRPVGGAEIAAPRLETLELDADDIRLGLADRFLEACDVPEYQAATAVEALSTAAASAGAAVLQVAIDEGGPRVRVIQPETAHPAEAMASPMSP